jgi:hypothetical protein
VVRAPQAQPVSLVGEADRQQQQAESQKAHDPQGLAELADVNQKDLGDRDCK